MTKKLNIQWFIEQNKDWEKILAEKPYAMTISRDRFAGSNLIMFKYSQIDSDFMLPIVRECRGIVLDEDTNEVVSYAFSKFGNVGESYCPELDKDSMFSTVKIDGSIIKIVKINDELLISTNGTINAFSAPIAEQIGCTEKSFGDLVVTAIRKQYNNLISSGSVVSSMDAMEWFKSIIEPGITYMFELVSPYSRVVIPYPETKLYFIGYRNNDTYQESFFNDVPMANFFETPKVIKFNSFDACIQNARELPWDEEGYVVMDKFFNRVKVKSVAWLSAHHLCNNHVMSYDRALELVRMNEVDEVLAYFPEFKDALMECKARYNEMLEFVHDGWIKVEKWINDNGYDKAPWFIGNGGQKRKDLAKVIFQNMGKYTGVAFALVDKKVDSIETWAIQSPIKNITKYLGYRSDD